MEDEEDTEQVQGMQGAVETPGVPGQETTTETVQETEQQPKLSLDNILNDTQPDPVPAKTTEEPEEKPDDNEPGKETKPGTESKETPGASEQEPDKEKELDSLQDMFSKKSQKQGDAFARMRTTNKKMETAINAVAAVIGIQPSSDIDSTIEAISKQVSALQAQDANVPVDVMQELNELRAAKDISEANRLRDAAVLGFTAVREKYGLKQKDLEAFAKELVSLGLNPYQSQVNVLQEYQRLHFDDIVKFETQAVLDAEKKRIAEASTHAPGITKARSKSKDVGGTKKTLDDIIASTIKK